MESKFSFSEELDKDGDPRSLQGEIPSGLFSHNGENEIYSELSLAFRPNII